MERLNRKTERPRTNSVQVKFNSHISHRKHTGKSLANHVKPHYIVSREVSNPRCCVFEPQTNRQILSHES